LGLFILLFPLPPCHVRGEEGTRCVSVKAAEPATAGGVMDHVGRKDLVRVKDH
jgi:hypothetical protein